MTARSEDSPLKALAGVLGFALWAWGVMALWAAFAPQGGMQ